MILSRNKIVSGLKICVNLYGQHGNTSMINLQSLKSISSYDHYKEREFLSKIPGGSVNLTKHEESGLAIITINHPERKNAMSGKMMVELADIVCDLEEWRSGRGVVLHGVQQNFCSGADIALVKSISEGSKGAHMSRYMQHTLTRLFNLPLVTIALLEGMTLGGGAELAIACDFRAISSNASIGFVQAKMGLSPGWGGGVRLVQILGRSMALRILASAKVMRSEEAKQIGVVDLIISDGPEALKETKDFLKTLTSASPEVVQAAKRAVINASNVDYEYILLEECKIFKSLFGGKANIEALSSKIKFT